MNTNIAKGTLSALIKLVATVTTLATMVSCQKENKTRIWQESVYRNGILIKEDKCFYNKTTKMFEFEVIEACPTSNRVSNKDP